MHRNRKRCPVTFSLLSSIPAASDIATRGIGESTFSALHAGAHLLPHCGSTNARLTAHLPLEVPEGACSIRVGEEVREYREGELIVFDDSFEHEVSSLCHSWGRLSGLGGYG
jgi:aspartate beta-hydroxylase